MIFFFFMKKHLYPNERKRSQFRAMEETTKASVCPSPWLCVHSAFCFLPQPMFSVAPSLGTNASAAFNPYLGPVSPSLVPAEILPTAPMLVTGNPGVPVPAAAAAAAQKLMRTDRLEVGALGVHSGRCLPPGWRCLGYMCASSCCRRKRGRARGDPESCSFVCRGLCSRTRGV